MGTLSMFSCQFVVSGVGWVGLGNVSDKNSPTKDVVTSSQKTAPGLIKYLELTPCMDGSMVGFQTSWMQTKHRPGVVYLIIVG